MIIYKKFQAGGSVLMRRNIDPNTGYPMRPANLKGKDIRGIQQQLGVVADGIWGPKTDKAYRESGMGNDTGLIFEDRPAMVPENDAWKRSRTPKDSLYRK